MSSTISEEFVGSSYIPVVEHGGQLYVALFRSRNAKVYCDLGGHRENSENAIETCIRETSEESLNTFLINPSCTKRIFYGGYYSYFEKINIKLKTIEKVYYKNKISLSTKNLPDYWKETDKVDFFPIIELIKFCNRHEKVFYCKNINGLHKKVWFRPIKFIKYAFIFGIFNQTKNNVNHLLNTKQIQLVKDCNSFENTTTIIV